MRKRDEHFVRALQQKIGEQGGVVNDAAKIAAIGEAYSTGYCSSWPPHLALKKARAKLKQLDILEALGDCYEGAAGFSIVEALQLHVAHIRGGAPQNASYQALKDYIALTVPAQPKRIESKNVNVRINAPPREGAPAMRARMVGPSPKVVRTIVQAASPSDDEGE